MPQPADNDLELFARCAAGFEAVLARELRDLSMHRVRSLKGGVAFFGRVGDAYRACLWSRVATRIQLVLTRLDARDAEALYAGSVRFAWEKHVAAGATISVRAHGVNDQLRNTQFTALKVKDALCDRLREKRGQRPDVDAHDPGFSIDVSVHRNHATLYLNLSGPSLHRRGYREEAVQTEAPLKETLAAGMLLAADWHRLARAGAGFADPMCGSGTLAIEAALIAADRAPGLTRTRWGFTGWARHEASAWHDLIEEARKRADAAHVSILLVAGDLDERAIAIARANAERAGVADLIDFGVAHAEDLGRRLEAAYSRLPERGLIAVNPPYGHRMQSEGGLLQTYAALERGIAAVPERWRMVAITPDAGIDTALGRRAERVVPCFNGPIRTAVRFYGLAPVQRTQLEVISLSGTRLSVAVAEKNSEQFAARLRKVARERAKWARRAGVASYRVYDSDLPDYALSVDVYAGAGPDEGARFVRVAEHPAPASIDADRADVRFADACALIPAILEVEQARCAVLGRASERSVAAEPLIAHVAEQGFTFEANLSARQDTGLPLDHRATRDLLGSLAQGARFLSVGSYAGVPAVYAAAGGAASVTVVDPAAAHVAWARRNVAHNGYAATFQQAEIAAWLSRAPRFDLIYGDAAALSTFDLIKQAAELLSSQGMLVLTSSARNASLDAEALAAAGYACEDATARTIGHDCARTPKIHRCWLIARG